MATGNIKACHALQSAILNHLQNQPKEDVYA